MLFQSNGLCPVCHHPGKEWCKTYDWEYRTNTGEYTYLQCRACTTLFIKEVPQELLSDIYPPNYYSFAKKSGRFIFKLKNYWDSRFYHKLLGKIDGPSLSVLDIGGGTGEVLDILLKTDKRISYTEIVDIDLHSGTEAVKKGHVYTHSTIEEYETGHQFDLILLLNIVEHVADPQQVIAKAGRLLKPGGIIIIKTPNCDSMDARLFQSAYWGGLHCPRHWVIFSDHSFKTMMKGCDLTILSLQFTQGAPFWAWSITNLLRKKNVQANKRPLIEHPLFAPLSIVFAVFDFGRSMFSKTSQMFIVVAA